MKILLPNEMSPSDRKVATLKISVAVFIRGSILVPFSINSPAKKHMFSLKGIVSGYNNVSSLSKNHLIVSLSIDEIDSLELSNFLNISEKSPHTF
jgi:hypothetical protein